MSSLAGGGSTKRQTEIRRGESSRSRARVLRCLEERDDRSGVPAVAAAVAHRDSRAESAGDQYCPGDCQGYCDISHVNHVSRQTAALGGAFPTGETSSAERRDSPPR
jgi:hypothetical protein